MKGTESRTVGFTKAQNYTCLDDLRNSGHVSVINPINLDYCGMEQCESGFKFGPYVRTCFVIHFVLSGKGILCKNDQIYHIEGGQAFIIYPHEECYYQADETDPWKYMWIGFHGFKAEEFVVNAAFEKEKPVRCLKRMDYIEQIMNKMLEKNELNYVSDLHRMSCLYALLAELSKNENKEVIKRLSPKDDYDYVKMAIDIMTSSYRKDIKVTELADTIGLNRSYFTTLFKKEMKMSPQEFLIQFRMEKAVSLLRTTKNSVSSIAEEIGYRDGLTFSKAFKREYGISPIEYREQKTIMIVKNAKGDYQGMWPL